MESINEQLLTMEKSASSNVEKQTPYETEQKEHPLISFVLCAYNQERFIREAVEGAFSQTYSPLEIILSDDCSQDRTFKIMEDMAAAYKGPHTILLNRNERNLGIGGHVNRIMELSHGEIIVGAAGDDISLPERTARTYEQWIHSNKLATSIYFNIEYIDENGNNVKQTKSIDPINWDDELITHLRRSCIGIYGASHSWHRRLFEIFGSLNSNVIIEDICIAFRSLLAGKIVYCDNVMVKYRVHRSSISRSIDKYMGRESFLLKSIFWQRAFYNSYMNFLKDSDTFISKRSYNLDVISAREIISRMVETTRMSLSFHTGNKSSKIRLILRLIKQKSTFPLALKFFIIYLFPNIYIYYLKQNMKRHS